MKCPNPTSRERLFYRSKVFKSNTVKCLLHDVPRILSLFVRLSVRLSVRPLAGVYFVRYYFKHCKQTVGETLNVW